MDEEPALEPCPGCGALIRWVDGIALDPGEGTVRAHRDRCVHPDAVTVRRVARADLDGGGSANG